MRIVETTSNQRVWAGGIVIRFSLPPSRGAVKPGRRPPIAGSSAAGLKGNGPPLYGDDGGIAGKASNTADRFPLECEVPVLQVFQWVWSRGCGADSHGCRRVFRRLWGLVLSVRAVPARAACGRERQGICGKVAPFAPPQDEPVVGADAVPGVFSGVFGRAWETRLASRFIAPSPVLARGVCSSCISMLWAGRLQG
jgi:hypothetical protein